MKATSVALALLGSSASAANVGITQTCPLTNLCYSLNIPDVTAQSGKGDIFFQISAATSYQWVALGQGDTMPGSNIFAIYSSADGKNVTLSPRIATGFVMPLHDTAAEVTLLAGSGISNGMMTANIKCSNCQSWSGGSMDFTSASASWIYAHKAGSPIDSDDPSENIVMHDDSAPFLWEFAAAKGGSDVNPFVAATSSSNPSGSPSTPTVVTQAPIAGSESAIVKKNTAVRTAHGSLASTAFLVLFPLGAMIIRLATFKHAIWVHVAVQALAWSIFITAVGLGLYLATFYEQVDYVHPIIGLTVFSLMFIQPFTGLIHHLMFKKFRTRTTSSWLHLGLGRVAIVLGISNGFLGLHWAGDATQPIRHAYLAIAVISLTLYGSSIVYGEYTRAKKLSQTAEVRSHSSGDESLSRAEISEAGKGSL